MLSVVGSSKKKEVNMAMAAVDTDIPGTNLGDQEVVIVVLGNR